MATKIKEIKGKSGITLIELIVTIVIISTVSVATASAISGFRHLSYINTVREKYAAAANGIEERIIADFIKNGFNDEQSYYSQIAESYLFETGLQSAYNEKADCIIEINDTGSISVNDSGNVGTVNYYTFTITLSNGKSDKYGVAVRQTIYLPKQSDKWE